MIKLRTFYIFRIRDEFYSLYKDNPNSLYSVLKRLYHMKKNDLNLGFNLYNQLIERLDKTKLDRKIYIRYHREFVYSKNGNDHVINNLYKDEVSILNIKHAYILINTNKNYSSFFNVISILGKEYFICDFSNNDYFWIKDIKILV